MKRTPLKRKPFRKALGSPELRLLFKRTVCARGLCTMGWFSNASGTTVECRGPLQAAHLLPKSRLRNLGFDAAVVYDPRAAIPLCERHHQRHDNHIERVPAELVPETAWHWAHDVGLTDLLYRYYPRWDDAEAVLSTASEEA